MSTAGIIFWVTFFIASNIFIYWLKKRARTQAEQAGTLKEYKTRGALARAVTSSVLGGAFLLLVAFQADRVQPELRPIGIAFMLSLAAWITYGWYRWYRVRQTA